MKGIFILEFSIHSPIELFHIIIKNFKHLDQNKFKPTMEKMFLIKDCVYFMKKIDIKKMTYFEWTILRLNRLENIVLKKMNIQSDITDDTKKKKKTLRDKDLKIPLPKKFEHNLFDDFFRRNLQRFIEHGFVIYEGKIVLK